MLFVGRAQSIQTVHSIYDPRPFPFSENLGKTVRQLSVYCLDLFLGANSILSQGRSRIELRVLFDYFVVRTTKSRTLSVWRFASSNPSSIVVCNRDYRAAKYHCRYGSSVLFTHTCRHTYYVFTTFYIPIDLTAKGGKLSSKSKQIWSLANQRGFSFVIKQVRPFDLFLRLVGFPRCNAPHYSCHSEVLANGWPIPPRPFVPPTTINDFFSRPLPYQCFICGYKSFLHLHIRTHTQWWFAMKDTNDSRSLQYIVNTLGTFGMPHSRHVLNHLVESVMACDQLPH